MPQSNAPASEQRKIPADDRDRLEIIRFATADAQQEAIGALMEVGMLNFSANRLDEWLVRTPIARKLRKLGVPFEWLTEHV